MYENSKTRRINHLNVIQWMIQGVPSLNDWDWILSDSKWNQMYPNRNLIATDGDDKQVMWPNQFKFKMIDWWI